MEFDFLVEGAYFDLLPLLPIVFAGYISYLTIKQTFPIPIIAPKLPSSVDILSITANINQHYIEVPSFHFVRAFLIHQTIRSSLDPFIL
ncbi:MAG TPA: hypothetical protein VJ824_11275 [Bacillota bacterium]|nr:hypothetical protein [Bacillota bacterium]